MKCNAHLYLPWSAIAELVASTSAQLPKARLDRPGAPAASVEQLGGGCLLYRLNHKRVNGRRSRDKGGSATC